MPMTYVVTESCIKCKYTDCVEVCPVDCCIPDEDRKESEEELLAKANKIHPDQDFPALDDLTNETSLFRNPDRKNANL